MPVRGSCFPPGVQPPGPPGPVRDLRPEEALVAGPGLRTRSRAHGTRQAPPGCELAVLPGHPPRQARQDRHLPPPCPSAASERPGAAGPGGRGGAPGDAVLLAAAPGMPAGWRPVGSGRNRTRSQAGPPLPLPVVSRSREQNERHPVTVSQLSPVGASSRCMRWRGVGPWAGTREKRS